MFLLSLLLSNAALVPAQAQYGSRPHLPNPFSSGCWLDTAHNITSPVIINAQPVQPHDVFLVLSHAVCAASCEKLPDLALHNHHAASATRQVEDCEITLQLSPNPVEAYLYRSKIPPGEAAYRECVDALSRIVNGCVKNGSNSGRLAGESGDRLYEAGFRHLVSGSVDDHVQDAVNEDTMAVDEPFEALSVNEQTNLKEQESRLIRYASR